MSGASISLTVQSVYSHYMHKLAFTYLLTLEHWYYLSLRYIMLP